jgi:hypothetical protein
MDNTAPFKTKKVMLTAWHTPDENTLILELEKIPPYTVSRDFSGESMPVNVYTDFGEIRLTLYGSGLGDNLQDLWLERFKNSPNLFLQEESPGQLTFWTGEYEGGYDWTSDGGIAFESKTVEHLPIAADVWREKYVAMVLHWDKLAQERLDILHQELLKDFVAHAKSIVGQALPDTNEPNKVRLYLNQEFDRWFDTHENMIAERAKAMATINPEHAEQKEHQQSMQQEINNVARGFWNKLFKR